MKNLNEGINLCWYTPIYSVLLPETNKLIGDLINTILRKEIEFLAKKNVDLPKPILFNKFSLFRAAQNLFSWDADCIKKLYELILPQVEIFLQHAYPNFSTSFSVASWANIHRFGDWHGSHSHFTGGSEVVSGVFWVKTPGSDSPEEDCGGNLILFDPRGPFFPEREKIILQPQAGKLILFPSWLQHEVTPLKSNDFRVSIGIDIKKDYGTTI